MGAVEAGDFLIGADGKPTQVVAATPVMHGRPCYEVEFSDGEVIVADALHQWVTWTPSSAEPPRVVTTEEILTDLREPGPGRLLRHAVTPARPLDLPHADLPVPPRELGAMLAGQRVPAVVGGGGEAGTDGRIPVAYLRGSVEQRRELLNGLVAEADGQRQVSVTSEALAADVQELVHSLGFVCRQTAEPLADVHASRWRYIADVRPVLSRPVRCVEVDSAEHMYLAGRSMVPTHNSALALDFARSATIRHQMPTVVFSLEMGRNEITMRLLAAEARVPMNIMRTGQMSDDDWTRLARRMSEVADAPLFIDDSPNMSLMEIRAKCRRLKQRHDLKLVIIDYLQLMSTPGKVESRQQEVSAMSRSLKLLAKELDVPVVALSQLNRGPEQRQDKKPMLSDLRESGCLTAETRILRADTGVEVTFGELMSSGERDIPVWSLDDRLKLVPRTMTHAFSSGVKEVFHVKLASGRELEATANHPFLTYSGWQPLGELMEGSRVAIARSTPQPLNEKPMSEAEIIMLAHLLGDGSFVKRQPIRYASVDPIAEWLESLGLFGLRSHEKFIPEPVFSLPKEQLALFLRHLWATDGSVTVAKSGNVRIFFSTTSERMARQLQVLLLRFGIVGRLHAVGNIYGHPQWNVDVAGVEEQSRFVDDIGVHGMRGLQVVKARARLGEMTAAGRFDTIPGGVWERVRLVLAERGMTKHRMQVQVGTVSRGDLNDNICPSRTRLGRIAEVLDDRELEMLATNDVFWDRVVSIESIGEQPVYDATVLQTHNFVANGTNLHNSIEQDADVVILLHREDAYERESPRAGEADLIVAKHRNGPTATVTVAFQGHYSRFVDMAPA